MKTREQFNEDRPIIKKLRERVSKGETLSENDLTYSIMSDLWVSELASDIEMAQIFNTTPRKVREIRIGYGLTNKACIEMYAKKYVDLLGSVGMSIMAVR